MPNDEHTQHFLQGGRANLFQSVNERHCPDLRTILQLFTTLSKVQTLSGNSRTLQQSSTTYHYEFGAAFQTLGGLKK